MIRIAPEMKGRKNPHKLFDHLILERGFKNDANIAEAINAPASSLSRIRSGEHKVGPTMILAIYDATDMTIEEIRDLL